MWPVLGGIAAGIGSMVSGWFSSDTSAKNTEANIQAQRQAQAQSEAFNAEQAQLNRDFQQQMSSTAFQRSRKDMEAAGLNPMMMGSMGGASTPGGSAASISTPNVSSINQRTSPMAGFGKSIEAAVNSAISVKTYEKMQDEIANIRAGTAVKEAEEKGVQERTHLTATERARLQNLMPVSRLEGASAEDVLKINETIRRYGNQVGWGASKTEKVVDQISSVLGSAVGVKRVIDAAKPVTEKTQRSGVKTYDKETGRTEFDEFYEKTRAFDRQLR